MRRLPSTWGTRKDQAEPGRQSANVRNGARAKTVISDAVGEVRINVPRDREGTFEPQIVKKRQRRLTEVDEIVLSLYAKGLATGDGGPASSAKLGFPSGVAVDRSGNVLIADFGTNRVRVVAASTGTFYGQAMTAGDIYTVGGNGTDRFSGDGGLATSAGLEWPSSVAVDAAGNLVIADSYSNRVRTIAG